MDMFGTEPKINATVRCNSVTGATGTRHARGLNAKHCHQEYQGIRMKRHIESAVAVLKLATVVFAVSGAINAGGAEQTATTVDPALEKHTQRTLTRGRQIFRFDTFGDE